MTPTIALGETLPDLVLPLVVNTRGQLRLQHRERRVERIGSGANEAAQRGCYGGRQALQQGRGQRGRDVEAGREALETLEAGREAETRAGGQTRESRGGGHKRGEAGLLTRLGLGV